MTRRHAIPLIALVAFGFVLYVVGIAHTPPYLADDEVMFAIQADSIARTGRDVDGRLMPLYFQMRPLGETSWFHPALVYTTALFLQVLPASETAVRVPSVFVGLTCVVLIYFLTLRILDRRMALVAAALLLLTPSHFMQSRIAMDYIYPVPFVLGWLLCLLAFLDRQRPLLLFAATTLLGVGVYTYIASVIMMPLYFAFTLVVLLRETRQPARFAAIATAGFAWPLLLIPLWLYSHPYVVEQTLRRYGQPRAVDVSAAINRSMSIEEILLELRRPVHFTSAPGRLSLYWYFYDPAFLFVTGGYSSAANSTRHTGVFLLPLLVLLPVGLWQFIRNPQSRTAWFVLFGFFTAPFAALLVPEPYAIDREMQLIPFGVVLATVGLAAMAASDRRWVRRALTVLVLLVPLHFAFFLYDYYVDYRGHAAFWFGFNHTGALEAVIDREEQRASPKIYLSAGRDSFMEAYWRWTVVKRRREDLVAKTVYYDATGLDVTTVPAGSLLVATRDDRALEPLIARGELRLLAEIPEPADPPFFLILQR